MHLSRLTPIFLLNLAAASPGCRNNLCAGTPCPAPSSCTTYSQTLTTCIPAPTCLSVYQDCSFGTGLTCCSGYCAATKCRPTDPKWPACAEDFQLCEADADCCYSGSKCVGGICRRV